MGSNGAGKSTMLKLIAGITNQQRERYLYEEICRHFLIWVLDFIRSLVEEKI